MYKLYYITFSFHNIYKLCYFIKKNYIILSIFKKTKMLGSENSPKKCNKHNATHFIWHLKVHTLKKLKNKYNPNNLKFNHYFSALAIAEN